MTTTTAVWIEPPLLEKEPESFSEIRRRIESALLARTGDHFDVVTAARDSEHLVTIRAAMGPNSDARVRAAIKSPRPLEIEWPYHDLRLGAEMLHRALGGEPTLTWDIDDTGHTHHVRRIER